MKKKELYAAPETEVLELRLEGVIATSGNLSDYSETDLSGTGWAVTP